MTGHKKAGGKKRQQEKPIWFEERNRIDADTWTVLSERASELAIAARHQSSKQEALECLGFLWGETKCLLEIFYIAEVREFQYLEPVPGSPSILLGLANLRGEIIPVFDLRQFWKIAREEITEHSKLIYLDEGGKRFGFWVDEISGISEEREDAVIPANQYSGKLNNDLTRGVLTHDQQSYLLLDGAAILAEPQLTIAEI
jgi:chemotaxis signal transduction protein